MALIRVTRRVNLVDNYDGEPYKHKATVSRLVNRVGGAEIMTRWGMSKCLTEDQIKNFNNTHKL